MTEYTMYHTLCIIIVHPYMRLDTVDIDMHMYIMTEYITHSV